MKKVWKTYNNLAQELGDQNTDKKRFCCVKTNEKKIIKIRINEAAENFTVNAKGFFKQAVSSIRLKKAWCQLKNSNILHALDSIWFEKNSQMLINGTFQYPMIKKVHLIKLKKKSSRESLNIVSPRIKIIEKALLNSLEIIFEGAYV